MSEEYETPLQLFLFNLHKLLLATHTFNEEPNYLMLAESTLLGNPSQPIIATDPENPFLPKVEITHRILVVGEVNRARAMPQNANVVAAKTCSSEVYVFDFTKNRGEGCYLDFRLKGHEKEGYGLSWSGFKNGYLLSGSNDHITFACGMCLVHLKVMCLMLFMFMRDIKVWLKMFLALAQ